MYFVKKSIKLKKTLDCNIPKAVKHIHRVTFILVTMPDMGKKLEDTKKLIRSILATYPSQLGVKLKDFLKDFAELSSGPLPFRQLGYNNAPDLLNDIPDVVHVSWERGEMILRCVADESMQHIMHLVNRQRISAAQKKKRFSRGPPNVHRSNYNNVYRPPRMQRTARPDHQFSRPEIKPAVVKPFDQQQIRELCFAYPSGLLGSEFDQAMFQRYGRQVDYRQCGFQTSLDMFRSMSDLIEVKQLPSGGYKIFARRDRNPANSQNLRKLTDTGKY